MAQNERKRKHIAWKLQHPLFLFLFVCFLFISGAFLRVYTLSTQPYWMDEGYTINAVLSIQEKGVSILDSGLPYSCPLYCYPTAWLADTLGNSAFSYRILSALAGTLFILVFFFITQRLFTKSTALLATTFLTFSYWHIAWAHQARWYTLFTVFFWLALFFFYRLSSIEWHAPTKKLSILALYAVLTVLCTVLAVKTHTLGVLLLLIFPAWLCIDACFYRKKALPWRNTLSYPLVAFGVGFVVLLVAYKDTFFWLLQDIHLYYTLPYYLSFYLTHYWLFIVPFILVFPFLSKEQKRPALFLFLVVLAYLIPLSFLTNIVHYRYLFHLTPALFMLGAVAFTYGAAHCKTNTAKAILLAVPIALFFYVGEGIYKPATFYTLESDSPALIGARPHIAYTPQPHWNNAYAYIQEHRKEGAIVVSSHPHFNKIFLHEAGYWIQYNYLGITGTPSTVTDGKEYYVGATALSDLAAIQNTVAMHHGFIVFDYMAKDGRIPAETVSYIETLPLAYHEKTNAFSEVWVYAF